MKAIATWLQAVSIQAVSLILGFLTPYSSALDPGALPQGGQVVSGSATLNNQGQQLLITQTTPKLALDWQQFNIGSASSVVYQQPNAQAVALNQVISAAPSEIAGRLSANGQIILINPNGITINQGAQINTAGLIASTRSLSQADFLAGNYQFSSPSANSLNTALSNFGTIKTVGGDVRLLADKIENKGVIDTSTPYWLMSAGKIILDSGAQGVTENSGLLSASAPAGYSGDVQLLGRHVGLLAGSQIDTSGAYRSGDVNIGGSWQGKGPLPNASAVYMDKDAVIRADNVLASSGGKVVLWSNDYTGFYGLISARGGPRGGNGGFVETSSHNNLQAMGRVDTSSPRGKPGEWLLDPADVTIVPSGGTANLSGGIYQAGNSSASINVAQINNALAGGSNVTVATGTYSGSFDSATGSYRSGSAVLPTNTTSLGTISSNLGNLKLAAGATINPVLSNTTPVTLSLQAGLGLTLDAAIAPSGTGKLNVNLYAAATNSATAPSILYGVVNVNNDIATNGGYLRFTTGLGSFIKAAPNSTNPTQFMTAGGDLIFDTAPLSGTPVAGLVSSVDIIIANSTGLIIDTTSANAPAGKVSFAGRIDSGNEYNFVSTTTTTWNNAYLAALAQGGALSQDPNAIGATYLATVGSALENYTVGATACTTPSTCFQQSWLGGARHTQNALATTFNGSSYTFVTVPNSATSTTWQWVGGPNAGQTFFSQTRYSNATPQAGKVSGVFEAWSNPSHGVPLAFGGEPNSFGSGEWVLQFYGRGGLWNDYAQSNLSGMLGYVVEKNLAPSPLTIRASNGSTAGGTVDFAAGLGLGNPLSSITVTADSIHTHAGMVMNKRNINDPNAGNITLTANNGITGTNTTMNTDGGDIIIRNAAGNINFDAASNFDAGSGKVDIQSSGNINLARVNAGTILIRNNAVTNTGAAGATSVTLAGPLVATAAGSSGFGMNAPLLIVTNKFVNNAGASALSTTGANSRWLVWSTDPAQDTLGGQAYGFKQYNAAYTADMSALVAAEQNTTRNGLLYIPQPVITLGLTGNTNKVYDATTTASINNTSGVGSNYSFTGLLAGDAIDPRQLPNSGTYDTKDVDTGKQVTVTGINTATLAIKNSASPSAIIYGYSFTPLSPAGTLHSNIGTITVAPLTLTPNAVTTTYDANNFGLGSHSGQTLVAYSADPLNYSAASGQLKGSDTLSNISLILSGGLDFNGSSTAPRNASTYSQGVTNMRGEAGNYAITFSNAVGNNYVINKSVTPLVLTPNAVTTSYNSQNFGVGANSGATVASYSTNLNNYTATGFLGSDSLSSVSPSLSGNLIFNGQANAPINAGSYSQEVSGMSGVSNNYNITFANPASVGGTATQYVINKGGLILTLTPVAVTTTYNATPFGVGSSSGLTLSAYSINTNNYSASGLQGSDTLSNIGATLNGTIDFNLASGGPVLTTGPINAGTYNQGMSKMSGTSQNYTITFANPATAGGQATQYVINKAATPLVLTPNAVTTTYSAENFGAGTNSGASLASYSTNPNNYTATGFLGSDTLSSVAPSLSGNLAFNGSATAPVNAGTYSQGVASMSGLSNNYNITFANTANNNYVIDKAAMVLSYVPSSNALYNSQTFGSGPDSGSSLSAYSQNLSHYTASGLQGQETLSGIAPTLTGNLKFNSQETAPVNSGSYSIDTSSMNASSSNYAITFALSADVYRITARPVTLTPLPITKIYDGGLTYSGDMGAQFAALTSQLGIPGSQVDGASLTYLDKNVGNNNKTVQLSGLMINGQAVSGNSNYQISFASNTTSSITPRPLNISDLSVRSKVYDGTPNGGIDHSGIFNGMVPGDNLNLPPIITGLFPNSNVSSYDINQLPPGSLLGGDAGNYQLTGVSLRARAVISPAPLVLTALSRTLTYGEMPSDPIQVQGLVQKDSISNLYTVFGPGNTNTLMANADYTINDGNGGKNYTVMSIPGRYKIRAQMFGGDTGHNAERSGNAATSGSESATPTIRNGAGVYTNGRMTSTENNGNARGSDNANWQVTDPITVRRTNLSCSLFSTQLCGRELDIRSFSANTRSDQSSIHFQIQGQ